jgi:putative tricarboxylic transport membrane protein
MGQLLQHTLNEKFGDGNIKGVIGPEGANNAQKATSMIPTVLFGIPGAPFAAVIMALFMYLGFELGTPDLAHDERFFDSLTFGFMWATVLVGVFCLLFTRYISAITRVPYKILFSPVDCVHHLGMCSVHRWVGRLFYSCSM